MTWSHLSSCKPKICHTCLCDYGFILLLIMRNSRCWRSSQHKKLQHLHHTEAIPVQNSTFTSERSCYFTLHLSWCYERQSYEKSDLPGRSLLITDEQVWLQTVIWEKHSEVSTAMLTMLRLRGAAMSFGSPLKRLHAASRGHAHQEKGAYPAAWRMMVRHKRIFSLGSLLITASKRENFFFPISILKSQ